MNQDNFVFTIAYGCGLILSKALESFHKYHDHKVHIVGTYKDFKQLPKHKNNEYIDVTADNNLKELYKNGHQGTAYIWTKVIKGDYTNSNNIIQIDSDVIFREECLSDIINRFNDYDLIGPRRNYRNNPCNRDDVRSYQDVVSTYFTGFKKDKISNYDFNTIFNMAVGYHNPLNHPVLDFFDPISFDILKNGGKVFYLDNENYGSGDENGNKKNSFGDLNSIMDFGQNVCHFAGVGSGKSFFENGNGNVPESYTEWAKRRYSLYMKLLHNQDIDFEYSKEDYEKLKKYFISNE